MPRRKIKSEQRRVNTVKIWENDTVLGTVYIL